MNSNCLPEPQDSRKEYEVNVYEVGNLDPLLSTKSQVVEIIKKDCFAHLSIQFIDALCDLHSIGYEKIEYVSFMQNQVDIYLR